MYSNGSHTCPAIGGIHGNGPSVLMKRSWERIPLQSLWYIRCCEFWSDSRPHGAGASLRWHFLLVDYWLICRLERKSLNLFTRA
jgi:hypothetical protein